MSTPNVPQTPPSPEGENRKTYRMTDLAGQSKFSPHVIRGAVRAPRGRAATVAWLLG
jgi:hypothetical protein